MLKGFLHSTEENVAEVVNLLVMAFDEDNQNTRERPLKLLGLLHSGESQM